MPATGGIAGVGGRAVIPLPPLSPRQLPGKVPDHNDRHECRFVCTVFLEENHFWKKLKFPGAVHSAMSARARRLAHNTTFFSLRQIHMSE
jgi:hypothetical protein